MEKEIDPILIELQGQINGFLDTIRSIISPDYIVFKKSEQQNGEGKFDYNFPQIADAENYLCSMFCFVERNSQTMRNNREVIISGMGHLMYMSVKSIEYIVKNIQSDEMVECDVAYYCKVRMFMEVVLGSATGISIMYGRKL
jgi:hypothetical protein